MNLYDRTLDLIKYKREKIISGGVNCIPWGIQRFEDKVDPGIEQKKYYMITANSKVGKSQITDFMFMHNAYNFVRSTQGEIKLKIFYFSLEMSDEQKMLQCLSHRLYVDSGYKIRVSPKQLRSKRSALDKNILDEIKKYKPYFKDFEDSVTFITDVKNPFGVFKYMRDYANANGTVHKKKMKIGEKEQLVFDYYEPDNPDEYVIIILDHASLLATEKGGSLFDSINKLSSDYFVELRNKYGYIPALIQQQASAQESLENYKFKKLKPTFAGLADCKNTQRDIDMAIGLYAPHRHEIDSYLGYDISKLKDNVRFLEVIGSREDGGGAITSLYFDGAVNFFKQLPHPSNGEEMQKVYNTVQSHLR